MPRSGADLLLLAPGIRTPARGGNWRALDKDLEAGCPQIKTPSCGRKHEWAYRHGEMAVTVAMKPKDDLRSDLWNSPELPEERRQLAEPKTFRDHVRITMCLI